MAELEKVIKGLECQYEPRMTCYGCDYFIDRDKLCNKNKIFREAVDLLKAQELPDVKPEKLEERTTKWLDQMTAEERLKEIAAILDDWDGYRTAKGLGGLINEIWAYALYPVKTQEPDKSKYDYHTDHTDCPWCMGGGFIAKGKATSGIVLCAAKRSFIIQHVKHISQIKSLYGK